LKKNGVVFVNCPLRGLSASPAQSAWVLCLLCLVYKCRARVWGEIVANWIFRYKHVTWLAECRAKAAK